MTGADHASMESHISAEARPFWSQSYYFMAYDPVTTAGCFIRFGFQETAGISNSWLLFFKDGAPLFQRFNSHLPYTNLRPKDGVTLAGATLRSLDPLAAAQITFDEADFGFDLVWRAEQPLVDSVALTAGEAGSFGAEIAHAHLEGTCAVTGTIRLRDGVTLDFSGVGGRDIAVGPRNWSAMRFYRLAWPIFPDGQTFIATRGVFDGGVTAFLKVQYDGTAWQTADDMIDTVTFEADGTTVQSVQWSLALRGGQSIIVQGRRLYGCTIPLDGFMLAEHLMEFTRDDGMIGYGLVECGYRLPWTGDDPLKG